MRSRIRLFSASLALVAGSLAFVGPPGTSSSEPPVYALVNARIFPVSSDPIEKGVVVLRKGIIEAVGPAVFPPPDARIIDASGMTVYPGLIDALSDVALDEPRAQSAGGSPRGGAPPSVSRPESSASAATPDERQGLTPYLRVADVLNTGNRKIESARAAGITTALVAPRRGIFQGLSALVNLSGAPASRMVLRTPVALHVSLQSSGGFGGGYPGSLMGVLAFVKQTLLDAQHYEAAWRVYNGAPGTERPEYSRALESLAPVLRQELPVFIPADTPAQIERVASLAEEFNLRWFCSGAAQAGPAAPSLKKRKVPVLLSAKFPERERDADPEAYEDLRTLRRRVEAPATAAALAHAGVSFAFQSGDMASPREFVRNVGRAVEAGLDRKAALHALTLGAAEIFGVSDRVGSIEKGKVANVVVATGDLFDARTRVKLVFIDGEKFDISEAESPRPSERPATRAAAGTKLAAARPAPLPGDMRAMREETR